MHWLMICSSVTCASRNTTDTLLQTGQVIQHMLFQKVMLISEEVVTLQPSAGKRHID